MTNKLSSLVAVVDTNRTLHGRMRTLLLPIFQPGCVIVRQYRQKQIQEGH